MVCKQLRKVNLDKYDLLISGNKAQQASTQKGEHEIWKTGTVKLLRHNSRQQLKI